MVMEEITKLVQETVTSEVFGVWFLIGAALVFLCRQASQWLKQALPVLRTQVTLL